MDHPFPQRTNMDFPSQDEHCMECGAKLERIDVALHRKLVNRGARSFLCKACLAKLYKTTEAQLDRMAENFRAQGCTLFL